MAVVELIVIIVIIITNLNIRYSHHRGTVTIHSCYCSDHNLEADIF